VERKELNIWHNRSKFITWLQIWKEKAITCQGGESDFALQGEKRKTGGEGNPSALTERMKGGTEKLVKLTEGSGRGESGWEPNLLSDSEGGSGNPLNREKNI